jgi:hypothetical protein
MNFLQPFVTKPGTINSFVAEREGTDMRLLFKGLYD